MTIQHVVSAEEKDKRVCKPEVTMRLFNLRLFLACNR